MLYFKLGGVGGGGGGGGVICASWFVSDRTFSKGKTRRVGQLVQGLIGDLSTCLETETTRIWHDPPPTPNPTPPLGAIVLPGSEDATMSQQVEPQIR